jgi:hypothetical protein
MGLLRAKLRNDTRRPAQSHRLRWVHSVSSWANVDAKTKLKTMPAIAKSTIRMMPKSIFKRAGFRSRWSRQSPAMLLIPHQA